MKSGFPPIALATGAVNPDTQATTMTAEQQQQDSDDTDGKTEAGFSMELPGVKLRLQESTVRLILEYGGGAWRWIVYATAAAIFAYSIGYTWQAFR